METLFKSTLKSGFQPPEAAYVEGAVISNPTFFQASDSRVELPVTSFKIFDYFFLPGKKISCPSAHCSPWYYIIIVSTEQGWDIRVI